MKYYFLLAFCSHLKRRLHESLRYQMLELETPKMIFSIFSHQSITSIVAFDWQV